MKKPGIPPDEQKRLRMLRSLQLLDTPAEERFDQFTRLAQRIFHVKIAVVSLVDEHRQWFKSRQGLEAQETPRDISFCGHAILGEETLVVPDATCDERFHDNPLVTGPPSIRFYAGHPLRAPDGSKLGTVCLIDSVAREPSTMDLGVLVDLTAMVEEELKLMFAATTDPLTELANRRGFEGVGGLSLAICQRGQKPATMLFFDLDRFKAINDSLGHAEGDKALRDMANALRQTFRDSDVIARLGGDEFAVLLTNAASKNVERLLERLSQAVRKRNSVAAKGAELVYSVGAIEYDPERHKTFAALLDDADSRMYEQKSSRR